MSAQLKAKQFKNSFKLASNDEKVIKQWGNTKLQPQLDGLYNPTKPNFNFMDGPPFVSASNLHNGHLLISYIKSCVINYLRMTGHNVDDYNGKDCHGLPIEMLIEKILDIKVKDDILNKYGISYYIAKCKEVIESYSGSWNNIFKSVGRFMDFDHEYKTMDASFMESVWWGFSELWKKEMVYKSFKIMPYSYKCGTALSNFEAGQNYKDKDDMTIFLKFPLKNDETKKTSFVVWTTTPWTLPSNVALCVNPTLDYVEVLDKKKDQIYIICKNTIYNIFEKPKSHKGLDILVETDTYKILTTFKGTELNGKEYLPPFTCLTPTLMFYHVIMGDFVTDKDGTGIVHIAPAFGEDDFKVALDRGVIHKSDIPKVCPIDDNGNFTSQVPIFEGKNVFDANPLIIDTLGKAHLLVKKTMFKHSYPFCPRTDTPLIYMAREGYFVEISQDLKNRMVEHNNDTTWTPDHIGPQKFKNWLENTCDWAISRERFFGTPLPIWVSDDGEEVVCVGSIQELMDLTNTTDITDIHRDSIDNLTIPSRLGKPNLKRVPYVFDCWFESGSVPFAQYHYPFENESIFDDRDALSDFVCEGSDQTRGWFYTLFVLSTALFDKPPFKHAICTGLVLDEHGNKISKRYGNYVNPMDIIEKYGSDALRLTMISSPATHGDSFRFRESDVKINEFKLYQYFNGLKFFLEHHINYTKQSGKLFSIDSYKMSTNITDKWILSRIYTVQKGITSSMATYSLQKATDLITEFIEDLINWYIKFNRNRIKGKNCTFEDQDLALSTLYNVYMLSAKIFAPFIPFLAETIYSKLKVYLPTELCKDSVHLEMYPEGYYTQDPIIEQRMSRLQKVCYLVRNLRSRSSAESLKIPLKSVTVSHNDAEFINDIRLIENYLIEETNCITVQYSTQYGMIRYKVLPNFKKLGLTYKSTAKPLFNILKDYYLDIVQDTIELTSDDTTYTLKLSDEDFTLGVQIVQPTEPNLYSMSEDNIIVTIDAKIDDSVNELYVSRLFVSTVQSMRKTSALRPWNKINIYYDTDDQFIKDALLKYKDKVDTDLGYSIIDMSLCDDQELVIATLTTQLLDKEINIKITNGFTAYHFIESIRNKMLTFGALSKNHNICYKTNNNFTRDTLEFNKTQIEEALDIKLSYNLEIDSVATIEWYQNSYTEDLYLKIHYTN